ncbi:MAG: universal stress protein [Desulfobulbus sp.]|nr:universal stress protein [Desulfobulbus sp.]
MDRFSTSLLGEAKTLLLATDGSPFSDGAIQEAMFFGQACQAKVIVLHVVHTRSESITAANFEVRKGRELLAPHFEYIRAMAKDIGVVIEVVVVGSSKPEKTIVEQAKLRGADVILIGRHGKAGRLSLLIGKMTAKVMEQGFPRVLVAPKDFIITGNRILVGINNSANSRRAVEEALSLGHTCTTLQRIIMLAVAPAEEERENAQALLDEVSRKTEQAAPPVPCDFLLHVGDPVEQILQTADRCTVDMILIGNRSKGGMPKVFKGHIADNIIGQAQCSVLVVTA